MQLLTILNDILDMGKVESGNLQLEQANVDLSKEISRVIDLFSVGAAAKGVEVVLDLADDFPRMVVGDAVRISQVFSNLVSNAGD